MSVPASNGITSYYPEAVNKPQDLQERGPGSDLVQPASTHGFQVPPSTSIGKLDSGEAQGREARCSRSYIGP